MRLLLLAVCLLIPAAAAQMAMPQGELGVEDAHAVPSLLPFESGSVDVDVSYDCGAMDTDLDVLRVHVNATARQRTSGAIVPVDQSGVLLVDLDGCRVSTSPQVQHFDARVEFTIGDFDVADILDVEVTLWAEIGEGNTYRKTDAVSVSRSIPLLLEPEAEPDPAQEMLAETQAPQDQLAPGPALPLLIAGMLALARRR